MSDDNVPTPRDKFDNELIEISGQIAKSGMDRIFMHLRDARETLRVADTTIGAKATIILASAALESNLAHLTLRAQAFAAARPHLYKPEQVEYLYGKKDNSHGSGCPEGCTASTKLGRTPAGCSRSLGPSSQSQVCTAEQVACNPQTPAHNRAARQHHPSALGQIST